MSTIKIRQRISELRRLDLRTVEIELIKSRLDPVMLGYMVRTPYVGVGEILYRGVSYREKPTHRSQLSYPPAEHILRFGRINRPHQSMFYCSRAPEAPYFELGLKRGDYLAFSKWSVTRKFIVNNVGY